MEFRGELIPLEEKVRFGGWEYTVEMAMEHLMKYRKILDSRAKCHKKLTPEQKEERRLKKKADYQSKRVGGGAIMRRPRELPRPVEVGITVRPPVTATTTAPPPSPTPAAERRDAAPSAAEERKKIEDEREVGASMLSMKL